MTKLFRNPVALALGAALITPVLVTPAMAGSGQQEIVVSPSSAMEEWRADVSRDLGRNLVLAERWAKHNPDSGIVQVRFQLDAKGRPANMQTYRSSGSVSTDRAARWAVRRLSDLDQGPAQASAGQVFQANIIFADSAAQKAHYAEKLAYIERRRLASAAAERGVIALGS
ncbi:energy transducer TonB family protein [Parerythrobacter jejuensis]|uniref:TonB family protein n=1 Tax=Parerythrobacter jejuensis TaxID=795812 RepID=A0A845ART1_9SPHN|nr:energy transducer TonB [Parerythrobacter jejuensis]MXP31216.1 TonB family protein [Parerythrobacter jejuensis]MXP33976.1 TonB family protein [Parerythrobacter jejuensis]